ncbi:hypothetical protein GCM10008992_14100 [Halorubrum aquaticum]
MELNGGDNEFYRLGTPLSPLPQGVFATYVNRQLVRHPIDLAAFDFHCFSTTTRRSRCYSVPA